MIGVSLFKGVPVADRRNQWHHRIRPRATNSQTLLILVWATLAVKLVSLAVYVEWQAQAVVGALHALAVSSLRQHDQQTYNKLIDVAAPLTSALAVPGDATDFPDPADVARGFDVSSAER